MIEQRLERLQNEIKSLKTSMPIAGSLIDIYFYNGVFTKDFPDNTTARWTAKFTPTDPSAGLGFTIFYEYCEALSNDPHWVPYNPLFLAISEGYYVTQSGIAARDDGLMSAGMGTFTAKVTISVYSTVPGSLSIEWS